MWDREKSVIEKEQIAWNNNGLILLCVCSGTPAVSNVFQHVVSNSAYENLAIMLVLRWLNKDVFVGVESEKEANLFRFPSK